MIVNNTGLDIVQITLANIPKYILEYSTRVQQNP